MFRVKSVLMKTLIVLLTLQDIRFIVIETA